MKSHRYYAERLYPVLVALALAGTDPITYKEAAVACGFNSPRGMGRVLEALADVTAEKGEPGLGTFVVLKDTGLPGEGIALVGLTVQGAADRRRATHAYYASLAADAYLAALTATA